MAAFIIFLSSLKASHIEAAVHAAECESMYEDKPVATQNAADLDFEFSVI